MIAPLRLSGSTTIYWESSCVTCTHTTYHSWSIKSSMCTRCVHTRERAQVPAYLRGRADTTKYYYYCCTSYSAPQLSYTKKIGAHILTDDSLADVVLTSIMIFLLFRWSWSWSWMNLKFEKKFWLRRDPPLSCCALMIHDSHKISRGRQRSRLQKSTTAAALIIWLVHGPPDQRL